MVVQKYKIELNEVNCCCCCYLLDNRKTPFQGKTKNTSIGLENAIREYTDKKKKNPQNQLLLFQVLLLTKSIHTHTHTKTSSPQMTQIWAIRKKNHNPDYRGFAPYRGSIRSQPSPNGLAKGYQHREKDHKPPTGYSLRQQSTTSPPQPTHQDEAERIFYGLQRAIEWKMNELEE